MAVNKDLAVAGTQNQSVGTATDRFHSSSIGSCLAASVNALSFLDPWQIQQAPPGVELIAVLCFPPASAHFKTALFLSL